MLAACRGICRRCNLAMGRLSGPRISPTWWQRIDLDTRMNGSPSKARIKIPLLCHCGDEEIPRSLSIHGQTVLVWLQKYLDYAPRSSPLIMSHSLFAHFAVRNVRKPEFVSFHEVRRACVHDRGQGPTFSQCGWRLWPQSWLPALLWGQPQT